MTSTQAKRLVFLSSSERLAGPAVHLLRSAGHLVESLATVPEARTWLRIHRADLVIVDHDPLAKDAAPSSELIDLLRADARPGAARLLVLARVAGEAQLRTLLAEKRLTNFLAVGEDDAVDPVDLSVTVAKILSRDIFGIQRYLAPTRREEIIEVRDSRAKEQVVARAAEFAVEAGCHALIADQLAVAVDELFTNAVYNAPVDANGTPKYASRPRSVPVELEPQETVIITVAADARRLCVSARDPFGSLKPERVLDFLAKCFRRGEDQIDSKEGGAGLGLYQLFNVFHSFVVNIAPGSATESIGVIEISKSFRRHSGRRKSFNIFLAEGPDGVSVRS